MRRFRPSTVFWMLAFCLASVLLAWPLHQAQHAAEPVIAALAGAPDGADAAGDSEAPGGAVDLQQEGDGHGAGELTAKPCDLCFGHAGHHAMVSGSPLALRSHAEADAPPPSPPEGLPTGRCTLAAEPRGPPRA